MFPSALTVILSRSSELSEGPVPNIIEGPFMVRQAHHERCVASARCSSRVGVSLQRRGETHHFHLGRWVPFYFTDPTPVLFPPLP